MSELASAVIGGLIGAFVSYATWRLEAVRKVRVQHDETLHQARLAAYREVWRQLELWAVYLPPSDVTYAHLRPASEALRAWYYKDGGLLMTPRTFEVYRLLMDALVLGAEGRDKSDTPLRRKEQLFTSTEIDNARSRLNTRRGLRLDNELLAGDGGTASTACQDMTKNLSQWEFEREPTDDYVLLQTLASAFRTRLTKDLTSRALPLADRDDPNPELH